MFENKKRFSIGIHNNKIAKYRVSMI